MNMNAGNTIIVDRPSSSVGRPVASAASKPTLISWLRLCAFIISIHGLNQYSQMGREHINTDQGSRFFNSKAQPTTRVGILGHTT